MAIDPALQTAKVKIDVASAFDRALDEEPVEKRTEAAFDHEAITSKTCAVGDVYALAPLDAIPVLALAPAQIFLSSLDDLSRQLLSRVDGATCTMGIVTGMAATPREGARGLAALALRGLVRLVASHQRTVATPTEDAPMAAV